jgi:hypothetical protein
VQPSNRGAGERGGREQLTPILHDPPSLGALMFIVARLLASPGCATDLARHAVSRYSITPGSIATVTGARQ